MKVNDAGMIPSFVEKPKADVLDNWKSPVSADLKKRGKEYLASMGIYIFNRKTLTDLFTENPDAMDFGKEIIPACLSTGRRVASYVYNGYWEDIGTIRSFFEANIELTDHIPSFNLFDNDNRIYTRGRMLPPAKYYGGTSVNRSIISDGSIIHARMIDRAIIGIRSRIGENSVIKEAIVMGNDHFQTLQEIALNPDQIPLGIGHNSHIEHCILDKDCRVGSNVIIKGGDHIPDMDTENYCVRDGVVVVKKNGTIADGTRIGV